MEQRPNYTFATLKDVRTLFRKEECAGGMEQRSNLPFATLKDALAEP